MKIVEVLKKKYPLFKTRSKLWKAKRDWFLSVNKSCAICGSRYKLEVHHIKPFHLFPDLELDDNNLITLCEGYQNGFNCHLYFAHLGNYKHANANLIQNIEIYKKLVKDIKIY